MRQDLTDITVILDRTGSMEKIKNEVITGFNTFLKEQRSVPGYALMTLVQFDSQNPFEVLQRGRPIIEVPELNEETYVPRSFTPLLDAIGRGINDTGARLAAMAEADRPGKVIFVVHTDGEENASKEFSHVQIHGMVERQQRVYDWQFVFIGATLEQMRSGVSLGMPVLNAAFAAGAAGTRAAYRAVSDNAASYRIGATAAMGFTPEQRKKMQGDGK